MFIKQKIDYLPEVHQDLSIFDFRKNSNYHTIRSKLIEILIGFKHTDHFEDAIQLALYYFERNNSTPMDIFFSAREVVQFFGADIQILCTAYIHACRGRQYYDHKGEFFLALIRANPDFMLTFVQAIQQDRIERDEWSCFDVLWQQEDFLVLITLIMEHLKETSRFSFQWRPLAESLLSDPEGNQELIRRRDEWIAHYIEKNSNDKSAMKFLFGTVCNLPEQRRLSAIVTLCANNPTYETFCNIPLMPTHLSWSGSEVPVIEGQINFLNTVRDHLSGIQYIEHRAHISEMIQHKQEYKERILVQEFLADR